jgi:hypothetical protein
MSGGKRRVERIPKELVEDIRRRVEAGRAVQEAIKETLAANAGRRRTVQAGRRQERMLVNWLFPPPALIIERLYRIRHPHRGARPILTSMQLKDALWPYLRPAHADTS